MRPLFAALSLLFLSQPASADCMGVCWWSGMRVSGASRLALFGYCRGPVVKIQCNYEGNPAHENEAGPECWELGHRDCDRAQEQGRCVVDTDADGERICREP